MDGINIIVDPAGEESVNVAASSGGTVEVIVGSTDERLPYYTGETDVTPDTGEDIALETAGTSVRENITVRQIPTYEVGNLSGGKTFIIGRTE